MAPAAGSNSSPATPHSGSSNPAVGATANPWTTPGCSRTGLTVGGFSGTVITCGGGGGAGAGAGPYQRGSGSWSCTPGVRPSPNVTFGALTCPGRVGAVIRAGPFIGRARFATRSDSARRTAVGVGSRTAAAIAVRIRAAAAAVVDVAVAPVRTAARASATVAVRAFAIMRMARITAGVGDRDGRAGPTYQKTCGHDANTCREAEVRLGQGSSPASGKDMQTRANCILACRCTVEEQLRTMHANLR